MIPRQLAAIAAAIAVTTLGLARQVQAGPFDAKVVGGDAKFVAFVDVEAGRKTAVGERILQQIIDDAGYQEFEKIMTEIAGFMPASDITDITIYGEKYEPDPKGVLVVHAKFSAANLRNGLGLAPKFQSLMHGDREYMTWVDDKTGKPVFACIFDATTILMAGGDAKLCDAIDVLADPTKSADAKSLAAPQADGMWAFVIGKDVGASPAASGNIVLGQLQHVTVALSQVNEQTQVAVTGALDSSAKAEQLFSFVTGMKALGAFAGSSSNKEEAENIALMHEMVAATRVAREANAVKITLEISDERAVQIIEDFLAKRDSEAVGVSKRK